MDLHVVIFKPQHDFVPRLDGNLGRLKRPRLDGNPHFLAFRVGQGSCHAEGQEQQHRQGNHQTLACASHHRVYLWSWDCGLVLVDSSVLE